MLVILTILHEPELKIKNKILNKLPFRNFIVFYKHLTYENSSQKLKNPPN